MHEIEPFDLWRHLYLAEEDELSPFYGMEHSEFEFSNAIYNYYIHPQWDSFGSKTLYLKILFVEYEDQYAMLQFIGEWNDAVEDDIMELKRGVIDSLLSHGITKFILILENVLSFHSGATDYYEEWYEQVREQSGWIVMLNPPEHEKEEFREAGLEQYVHFLVHNNWRIFKPDHLFELIDKKINEGDKRLGN